MEYARRHQAAWLVIGLLTLAGAGLAALQPWPMKLLFDQVLDQKPFPARLSCSGASAVKNSGVAVRVRSGAAAL